MTESEIIIRQEMITGTDATAICGLNGFRTIADVYLAKKFPHMITPPTGAKKKMLEMGNRYEPIIAQMYAERLHCDIFKPEPKTFCNPKIKWLGGSPDFLWRDNVRGLECKKVSSERYYHNKSEWGPDGSDQIPYEYMLQIHHYMMLCGIKEWDLAALIGDFDFRVYRLYVDKELCAMLLKEETEFFEKYVQGDAQPEFSNQDLANYLKKKYPLHSEKTIEVTPHDVEIKASLERMTAARAAFKTARDERLAAILGVQQHMGDAGEMIWAKTDDKNEKPLTVYWKKTRDGVKIDWKTVALRALDFAPTDARNKILQDHSEPKPGVRRFSVYGEDDEED